MANTITRWQPTQQMQQMTTLHDAINRLFGESFMRPTRLLESLGAGFAMDIFEEGNDYIVDVSMPGVKPEDVDISLQGNTLTIKGKISELEAKGRSYLLQERMVGEFFRTVTLPVEVDSNKVDATFENGILHLVLPKAAAYQPKRITVKASR